MRGTAAELGIFRESGHEHFTGSLVIPVFDLNGEVVRDVRAEDHASDLRAGHAAASVSAGAASRRVERSRR